MVTLRRFNQSASYVTALTTLLLAFVLCIPLAADPADGCGSVTVAWDPNPEPDVTGYRVHYGSKSGDYTEVIDVGPATEVEINGLIHGKRYFCSVTAYNNYDMDSDFAEELVIYTTPDADQPTGEQNFRISRVSFGADHLMTFEVSGITGLTVEVWASHNLADWTLIDTLTDVKGPISVQDPGADGEEQRFYRLKIPGK